MIALTAPLAFGACSMQQPERQFQPSDKSAVEMRVMQTRVIEGEAPTVMRGVVATLHDLGYRINKAEPSAGTVTATKLERVRLTAVVQQRESRQSIVRANAVVLLPRIESQVDDPQFYLRNFFVPLSATLGREAFAAPSDNSVPEAARPQAASDLPGATLVSTSKDGASR
jgi:hypothetical protein